jgi:hypothetical protein
MQAAEEENWSSINDYLENHNISAEAKKKIINRYKTLALRA